MRTPITRLYDTAAQASDAVNALKKFGFNESLINVVPAASPQQSLDAVVASITAGFVLKADARIYAESVRQGKTLVSIRAPFANGVMATRILEKFRPVPSPIVRREEPGPGWDEAAPLSSALQLPVLAGGGEPFSETFGMATLARDPAPFSSLLGLKTLSRGAAPFSSLLGLPLLSKGASPFSSMLGLPLLTGRKSR